MDKYLTSSQKDEVNNKINTLRNKAFMTNSNEDVYNLAIYMLHQWSDGNLVSRDLIDKCKDQLGRIRETEEET